MIKFDTTVSFINSHVKSSGYTAGEIISFEGYTNKGDKGSARWKAKGTTGTVSQDPLTNNAPELSDASGNEFELVGEGVIDLNVLGGTGVSYQNIADAAGLTYSQGLTSNPNVSDRYIIANEAGMVARANPQVGEAYIVSDRADGIFDTVTVGTTPNVDLPNTYNIIISTADPTICFVLRLTNEVNFTQLGIIDDAGAADSRDAVQHAIDLALLKELPLNGTYGTFRLDSVLDKIEESFTFRCDQKGAFILLRNYTEADPTRGVLHAEAGTQDWINIYIHAAAGTTGGAGFSLIATATTSPDFSNLDGILATGLGGTGTFAHPFHVDGSARTGAALGIRDLQVNGDMFAGTTHIALFKSVNNTKALGFNCFSAGGTATTLKVDGTASSDSNNFYYSGSSVPSIDLDRLTSGHFSTASSMTSVTNTSNVSECIVVAPNIGSVQYNWTNSKYVTENIDTITNGSLQIWDEPNGSTSNNLEIAYSATSGTSSIGPQAFGSTIIDLKTTLSGVFRAVWSINSNGGLEAKVNQSAASAANASLFVDSADSKLKYKDSGGTVNLLY